MISAPEYLPAQLGDQAVILVSILEPVRQYQVRMPSSTAPSGECRLDLGALPGEDTRPGSRAR